MELLPIMSNEHKLIKLTYEELKHARPAPEDIGTAYRLPIAVVCENIRSLYNVGSIFRTSDGAGIERLYLCGYTGFPPRREIDKTALGSVESVPWEYLRDPAQAVHGLRSRGYFIVALEHTRAGLSYAHASYPLPLCIVLGNEVDGVSERLLGMCDAAVEIPMHGLKQSLNVSVAYGILVYHVAYVIGQSKTTQ
jgi:tRNA G18 (ribose-2'-O)-methylase SpoU